MPKLILQLICCYIAMFWTMELCSAQTLNVDSPVAASQFAEKRAPSGFLGMRGKKFTSDRSETAVQFMDDDLDKRAPSYGFQGMRGKKLFEPIQADYYQLKRVPPMGFNGMRGKKASGEHLWDIRPNLMLLDNYNDDDKRAPNMGFQGMRGKKSLDDGDFIKRAPVDGFFGVRGKKLPAAQSGFFGMRGKKYPYEFRGPSFN